MDALTFFVVLVLSLLIFLLLSVFYLIVHSVYRSIAFQGREVEIGEACLIYHGPGKDWVIPWTEITDLELGSQTVGRAPYPVPYLRVTVINRKHPLELVMADFGRALNLIQAAVKERSPLYQKKNIDLVLEWKQLFPEDPY